MAAKPKKEMFENTNAENKGVRINKYLADAGVCSRREGDSAIEAGLVTIDGVTAQIGSRVLPGQKVTYKGKDISKIEELVLIAFNKPVGIVCTTGRRDPDNIIDYISYDKRIFPIGRLDKDSEGLILLTNDGNIVNKILRAGNYHEKEYIVRVNKEITPEFLEKMASGVPILETVTRPCTIEQVDKFTFRIILTQGLNRQIRRMCEALDYRVCALQRVRIMNVTLGRLKVGTYRNLTDYELSKLKELISDSSNAPVSGEFAGSEGSLDEEDVAASRTVLTKQARERRSEYRSGRREQRAEYRTERREQRAEYRSDRKEQRAEYRSDRQIRRFENKSERQQARSSSSHTTGRTHQK